MPFSSGPGRIFIALANRLDNEKFGRGERREPVTRPVNITGSRRSPLPKFGSRWVKSFFLRLSIILSPHFIRRRRIFRLVFRVYEDRHSVEQRRRSEGAAHSPGMILRQRTYVIDEDAVGLLRNAGSR